MREDLLVTSTARTCSLEDERRDSERPDIPPSVLPELPLQEAAEQASSHNSEDVGAVNESPLLKGARKLESMFAVHAGPLHSHKDDEQGGHMSTRLRRAHAAAECTTQTQGLYFAKTLEYCQSQAEALELEPILLLEHRLYDETPLWMRVYFSKDQSDTQKAKLWVVERHFSLLLKRRVHDGAGDVERAEDFLCLSAQDSPGLRATQNVVGETVRAMLTSCEPSVGPLPPFQLKLRLAETDEGGNNSRAEHMLMKSRPDFSHLWGVCLGHKIHLAAKKTWCLSPLDSVVTGVKNSCLVLRGPGAWTSMRDAIPNLLLEHFEYQPYAPISEEAQAYKDSVLEKFLPAEKHVRKNVVVKLLSGMLNTDWRQPRMGHACAGCCKDADHAREKLAESLRRFCSALRPTMLNEDNWQNWGAGLHLFALGAAMHRWLPKLFLRVVEAPDLEGEAEEAPELRVAEPAQGAGDPALDELAAERLRIARAQRLARDFFSSNYLPDMYLMQAALQPEQDLMSHALHQGSAAWEVREMQNLATMGWRNYRVLSWNQGLELDSCIQRCVQNFASAKQWQYFPHTEAFWSRITKVSLRPAAVLWSLMRVRTKGCPYKVFGLIAPLAAGDREALATSLLQTPRCLRDQFTSDFLVLFPTVQRLLSERARQILTCIAAAMATTTSSVERQHSRNARRAKHRVQTHLADLRALALSHCGYAAPAWAAHALRRRRRCSQQSKKVISALPKTQKRKRGGGGAWRAYQHHHLQGKRFQAADIRSLAQTFRALTPAEKEHWQALGRRGLARVSPTSPPITSKPAIF